MNSVKLIAVLLPLFVCLSTTSAFAGGDGSGGGDAIRCSNGRIYALDYELTKGSTIAIAPAFQDRSQYPTGLSILKAIANGLNAKIPAMGLSLQNFLTFNEIPSASAHRLWINTGNPLVYLNDQDIDVIPKNCLSHGQPNVWQTVIRTPIKNGFVIYKRDPRAIAALTLNSPLQVSFMYIHEWLRDYTNDADVIRNVNLYLHSLQWEQMSDNDFRSVLADFGISSVGKMATTDELNRDESEYKAMESHLTYGNPADDAALINISAELKKCDNMKGSDAKTLNNRLVCLDQVYFTDFAKYGTNGLFVYRDVIEPYNKAILAEIEWISNRPSMLN